MKRILPILMVLSVQLFGQHQFLTKPKIEVEDLKYTKSAIDEKAPAEVIFRQIHYQVETNGTLNIKLLDRVKIFDKARAGNYLDKEISVYEYEGGRNESLTSLRAYTYNLEGENIQQAKVERDSKFRSKEDKRYNITKFTFPEIKNGSVIEYSYHIISPNPFEIPKFTIEEDIPVRYVEYIFDAPKSFGYNINYQGNLFPQHRVVDVRNIYGAPHNTWRLAFENLKPFGEEDHVLSNDRYKTAIRAELNSYHNGENFQSFASSWDDIKTQLNKHEKFGSQLNKQNLVKDILPTEIKSTPDQLLRASKILKFVQQNYSWDNSNSVITDKGIKNTIKDKTGNSAELNMLLIMLMRNAGLDAHPVVLATIGRAPLLAHLPSINNLNYVVAGVKINNHVYIYDASSKFSEANILPPKVYNGTAYMITPKEAVQLMMANGTKSHTYLTVESVLMPDGTFLGKFSDRDTATFAMLNADLYAEDPAEYQKEYKERYTFPFKNIKTNNVNNNEFETTFDYTSNTFADNLGSKLAFNPLLFLYAANHSFSQSSERKLPIQFISRYDKVKKSTITLPDGYVFENIPKSQKIKTEDDGILYSYTVTQQGNRLTVETITTIDDTEFPREYYPAFKQIFDTITKLEGQVVTAVKKK